VARIFPTPDRVYPSTDAEYGRSELVTRVEEDDMSRTAAITINRPLAEVRQLWQTSRHRPEYIESTDASVSFREAPGDRGTEIIVDLEGSVRGGVLGEVVQKLVGSEPYAKVKDDLRRFKQYVETGEIARSDAVPEGELAERKLKQRPAQPLEAAEAQKVGAR
jgi:uncharacterized membrane protein